MMARKLNFLLAAPKFEVSLWHDPQSPSKDWPSPGAEAGQSGPVPLSTYGLASPDRGMGGPGRTEKSCFSPPGVVLSSIVSLSHVQCHQSNDQPRHMYITRVKYPIQRFSHTFSLTRLTTSRLHPHSHTCDASIVCYATPMANANTHTSNHGMSLSDTMCQTVFTSVCAR